MPHKEWASSYQLEARQIQQTRSIFERTQRRSSKQKAAANRRSDFGGLM
jgi:hypothetical protein